MNKIIIIIFALSLSFNLSAGEPKTTEKPMIQLGGGKVVGTARIIGMNGKATIIACDKSEKTCLYVLKKVQDDPGLDQCSVMQTWPVPPAAQSQFDPDYPYAFSFDTSVLKFYPASEMKIGCPDQAGNLQVSITTEATIELP